MKSTDPLPFSVGDAVSDGNGLGEVRRIRKHIPVRIGVHWLDRTPKFQWHAPAELLPVIARVGDWRDVARVRLRIEQWNKSHAIQ